MERAHKVVLNQDPHLLGNVMSMRAAIMSAAGEPATAERMFDEVRILQETVRIPPEESAHMLRAIHYYQSCQLEKVRNASPRVAAACREKGDAWNASSVEFYGVWAEIYCGRPDIGAAALPDAVSRAEKIGHYGALWALKIAASILNAASGDLAASKKTTVDAWEFGAEHDLGWNFATSIQRGHFALWSGNLAEAEDWYSQGLHVEGRSYLSGLSEASLFAAYAESNDARASEAWANRRWKLPVSGQLNSLGAWNALERSVVGLARLGRREEVAALWPLTEELLHTGAWMYTLLSPFQTIAGTAAACAGNWAAAEQHHLNAIRQTDTAPYIHLQPVAREWYANMLLERNEVGDAQKAEKLLNDAIRMYQASGLAARASTCHQSLAGC
jgi:hypothetical protein